MPLCIEQLQYHLDNSADSIYLIEPKLIICDECGEEVPSYSDWNTEKEDFCSKSCLFEWIERNCQ